MGKTNRHKPHLKNYKPLCAALIIIIGLLLPLIVSLLVYKCAIFDNIPGKNEDWLGFWGSYAGALVTLCIAYLTWKNSNTIEKLQPQYYELETHANLRLNKVSIIPKIVEEGTLEQYWMIFTFENLSKCLIHEISILGSQICLTFESEIGGAFISEKNVKIAETTEKQFLLQNNTPTLQFLIVLTDPDIKKAFAQFCYYYSQFSPEIFSMRIKMLLEIDYGENAKSNQNTESNDNANEFTIDLLPSPIKEKRNKNFNISEERYFADAYETYIKNYNISKT